MSETARKLGVFPAFHKVEGRRVVVVGGGAEAAAKIRLLAETKAEIVVFARALDRQTGVDLIAAHGDWRGKWPSAADLEGRGAGVRGDRRGGERSRNLVARPRGGRAGQRRRPPGALRLLHAGDRQPGAARRGDRQRRRRSGALPPCPRPHRGACSLPPSAISPGLAERLRDRVSRKLGTVADRRRFWARFFSGAVAEKVFAGRLTEAEDEALGMLEIEPNLAGHVSLVGAGPGAEDLLTLRAQRALQEADVIVYDRLVPEAIVAQGRRDARRIYVGKAKGDHSLSQDEINALSSTRQRTGHRVVRLKSGDPLIFGRAGEEMAALRAAGVSFDMVPGITAAFAAAAETEIPLTLRETSSSLVFATGHDADGETLPGWAGLALQGTTVAVYMGRTVAAKVAARLIEAGLAASTPVAVIENASRTDRRAYAGRLDELARIAARPELTGPVLFIVGEVVAAGAIAAEPAALTALAA